MLLFLTILGSGVGFVTTMLVSGFWSAAFSQEVFHFSICSAFYFLALGLGSLLSAQRRKADLSSIWWLVLGVCAWAALAIPILKGAARWQGSVLLFPILAVLITGVLVGQLIPLALRVRDQKLTLATLFFGDYLAALVFTLLFTWIWLVRLGYSGTGLLVGISGLLAVALVGVRARVVTLRGWGALVISLVLPVPLHGWVARYDGAPILFSALKGEATVLFGRQTRYQKIVLVEETSADQSEIHHVLYLDGFPQFTTQGEKYYHACIADAPVRAARFNGLTPKTALILGGGDGLAARNLLHLGLEKIRMVELDPEMIEVSRTDPRLKNYNQGSLDDKRVEVNTADAFQWVQRDPETYDIILIDFPAPKNLTLARLFSSEFYRRVSRLLSPGGFMAVQSGPAFSFQDRTLRTLSTVTTSVRRSLSSVGSSAWVYTTRTRDEAFILSTNRPFDMARFATANSMEPHGGAPCLYDPQWQEPPAVVRNTLNDLRLTGYLLDWFSQTDWPLFYYRGSHAAFLPN